MEKTIRLAVLLAVALPLIAGACATVKRQTGDDDGSGDDGRGVGATGCCYYIECDADQYSGGMEADLTRDQCNDWCHARRQKPDLARCRTGYSATCPPTGPDWYENPKAWCGK